MGEWKDRHIHNRHHWPACIALFFKIQAAHTAANHKNSGKKNNIMTKQNDGDDSNKTVITLKGSVSIVADFFFTAINSILYQRGTLSRASKIILIPFRFAGLSWPVRTMYDTRRSRFVHLFFIIFPHFFSCWQRYIYARDVQA